MQDGQVRAKRLLPANWGAWAPDELPAVIRGIWWAIRPVNMPKISAGSWR